MNRIELKDDTHTYGAVCWQHWINRSVFGKKNRAYLSTHYFISVYICWRCRGFSKQENFSQMHSAHIIFNCSRSISALNLEGVVLRRRFDISPPHARHSIGNEWIKRSKMHLIMQCNRLQMNWNVSLMENRRKNKIVIISEMHSAAIS